MALNVLDRKTREVIAASYALPDLETAIQQVVYNAIDAHAKRIRLSVNVVDASFSAVDDGDGIQPDDLYKFIGECYASSRNSPPASSEKQQRAYGSRGAFLFEMIALAKVVEIESRVQDHWTSWRKVFKEGEVAFNAASKQIHEAPGTKVCVSNLFGKLPVRHKDLSRNRRYRRQVIQDIHNFCVSISMIWPSLSLDIQFKGEEVRPVIIPAVKSCDERFQTHFGPMLGDELHYVSFSSKTSQFSIRGYFAFIPGGREGLAQGIKQAKSYYQFAFLGNEWVRECQQICSRVITDAALECLSAIPIFILKVAAPSKEYDILRIKTEDRVLFKNTETFQEFLVEFVQSLTTPEESKIEQTSQCGAALPKVRPSQILSPAEAPVISDLLLHQMSQNAVCLSRSRNVDHITQASFSGLSDEDLMAANITSHDQVLFEPEDFLLPNTAEDRVVWPEVFEDDYISNRVSTTCQACGQTNVRAFEVTGDVDVVESEIYFQDEWSSYEVATHRISEGYRADFQHFDQEDDSRAEGDLEDIFFSSQALVVNDRADDATQKISARTPWFSSKPDAYDCADVFLGVYQDHQDTTRRDSASFNQLCERDQTVEYTFVDAKQSGDETHSQLPLPRPAFPSVTSTYFDEVAQTARSFRGRWSRLATTPVKHLSAALRVDSVQLLNGLQSIKISKSTLADMKVIRQVDRKFILVKADTTQGMLLLCIDQHAADERVRLEKLEEDMFGRNGALRRLEIQRHEPPLVFRMNAKERETLHRHEELISRWGFDFEFTAARSERLVYVHDRSEAQEEERVLLHATPKVEKRVANGDDFRDFIQLLAGADERNLHSNIRPPVITRLLHSRACRSAIMFGDHLSTGQCKDLIEKLKTCQLPFQCAHGRPSVVPLAEIQRNRSRK
ncbi:hypothetical protein PR002_g51 [Phytophthora rubi]|uniref:MutL C-terminal dimerisation domain-containing protein n=1 Tax=Phytophthora rubi TaxID=129364 RepID=A0A6A3P8U3_9STRA|nr:hypothetical protein PR002_g51 [Phytophthora rubi]